MIVVLLIKLKINKLNLEYFKDVMIFGFTFKIFKLICTALHS